MRKGVRISASPPPPSSESNGRLLITRVMYLVFTVRHDRLCICMSVSFLFKAKLYVYQSSAAGEEGVPPDTNVTPGFRLPLPDRIGQIDR